MSDPTDLMRAVGATPASVPAKHAEAAHTPAVAFHALIERLQTRAKELEASTRTVSDAKDLAGAVDRARHSFQEALSLGESLIEAYRQSLHQSSDAQVARAPSDASTIPRSGDGPGTSSR